MDCAWQEFFSLLVKIQLILFTCSSEVPELRNLMGIGVCLPRIHFKHKCFLLNSLSPDFICILFGKQHLMLNYFAQVRVEEFGSGLTSAILFLIFKF